MDEVFWLASSVDCWSGAVPDFSSLPFLSLGVSSGFFALSAQLPSLLSLALRRVPRMISRGEERWREERDRAEQAATSTGTRT